MAAVFGAKTITLKLTLNTPLITALSAGGTHAVTKNDKE